jgi:ABC-type multidrug transport system ATPase subunit
MTTDDVKSPRRQYLFSCNVSLNRYWAGCLCVDFCLWAVLSFLSWTIFLIIKADLFIDHIFYTIWVMLINGISTALFVYCLAFIFNDPQASTGFISFIYFLIVSLVYVADLVRGARGDSFVSWIYALFPPINGFASLAMLVRVPPSADFGDLWRNNFTQPLLIFQILNIPIYFGILQGIEWLRVWLPKRMTRRQFLAVQALFGRIQNQQPITEEARHAAQIARDAAVGQFAICVRDVSRVFYSSVGLPIAAVNNVSLAIQEGCVFGFLGANGPGKTTLMKMITGELGCSSGLIEVNGFDISATTTCYIAMCPQFNDHIAKEATAEQHLKIFSMIFGFDEAEASEKTERLITELELEEHRKKPVRELSGGNARKLAVAIALLSPATVVLLDEPTSSLDPIVRHKVHDLINSLRGQKTFMLCTHLLGEAETLCDTISIMIRGSIFVVGTPQYLANRFGTEWRVDVLLDDTSLQTDARVSDFFQTSFPDSKLVMWRPKNRIYSIPAASIPIAELFRRMKAAATEEMGIKFFTCSACTLEKVFLELVAAMEEAAHGLGQT